MSPGMKYRLRLLSYVLVMLAVICLPPTMKPLEIVGIILLIWANNLWEASK